MTRGTWKLRPQVCSPVSTMYVHNQVCILYLGYSWRLFVIDPMKPAGSLPRVTGNLRAVLLASPCPYQVELCGR